MTTQDNQAAQVRVDGRQTFWKLCDHFNRETLYDGLKAQKWHRHCPQPRSNTSALREALQALVRSWGLQSVLVRPLENPEVDGFVVVRENTDNTTNEYAPLFSVCWRVTTEGGEPHVVVTEHSHKVDAAAIQQWFLHFRKRITSHAVAKAIKVIILEQLGGTSLRPSGGFYWLPAPSLDAYQALIDLVYAAADDVSRCKIYLPAFNLSDPGAVEAVRDAIVDDINRRRELIEEQTKRTGIKERALRARRDDAQALHARITSYEAYLGETLAELHKVADNCEQTVVEAALEEFPDLFGIGERVQHEDEQRAVDKSPLITADDINPFGSVPAILEVV